MRQGTQAPREPYGVEQVVIAAWQLDLIMKNGITCNSAQVVTIVTELIRHYDAVSIHEVEWYSWNSCQREIGRLLEGTVVV